MRWWKDRPSLTRGAAKPFKVKKHVIQPYVGGAIAVSYIGLIVYFFATEQKLLGLGALFGLSFGILIERGQVCFTSASRDLFLVGRSIMASGCETGMMYRLMEGQDLFLPVFAGNIIGATFRKKQWHMDIPSHKNLVRMDRNFFYIYA